MLQRDIVGLPTSDYPPEEWALVETGFRPRYTAVTETIFAVSNGYLGLRAVHDEGRPFAERGTLINGFHEQWPIVHAEEAYGFARTGQTIIAAPDPRRFHLYVDDEILNLSKAEVRDYERRLDFRTGQLTRRVVWQLPSGVVVEVRSAVLTSLVHRHLVALRYSVEVLEGSAPIVISSQLRNEDDSRTNAGDPRLARGFEHEVLQCQGARSDGTRQVLEYRVPQSGMTLACGIDHVIAGDTITEISSVATAARGKTVVSADGVPGAKIEITKFAAFHTSDSTATHQLADRCDRTLDRAVREGWDAAAADQASALDAFWDTADVRIGGNATVQQAVRWSLFHIHQAAARSDDLGIPAKGLTGSAYEGHYFWDTEVYVLPFLIYTQPRVARNLLRFRHRLLDAARQRAIEVGEVGALFPWRTITGEEASAYYEAGTAQYHINADISYAVEKYGRIAGDLDFLGDQGAEILVETARLYAELGFFRAENGDTFHIHGVTGPDEYTTVVDDNAYTNLMAAKNLADAALLVEHLAAEDRDAYLRLVRRTGVSDDEVATWKRAANQMYLPYDDDLGVTPQDAHFLELQRWDFEGTPREKYPLLLHFHPLVIYRHQVTKQADVVLAMFLRDECFDLAHVQRNFEYYDPLTTGDSSLSTSVQSIIASRIGNASKAIEYFRYGVFMDLADVAGNTSHGVHVAAAGGVWLSIVYGFGGLTDTGEHLAFRPRLPSSWEDLQFALLVRGQRLDVTVERHQVTYALAEGDDVTILHEGGELRLRAGTPVTCDITSTWVDLHREVHD
ncbi:glycoside hydrolase family 65 protein [Euzebya sp.]|uniref:glycoside hydrolase family 65 protein n=1 Tax=Euzebya sp. TaxID=1971409 RepID=UPI0035149A49